MDITSVYLRMPSWARAIGLDVYGWWQARRRFGGDFARWYDELLESQWLSIEEHRARQLESLNNLLKHAYATVPYYRRKFDDLGVHPADVTSLEDLKKLPHLTRQDVFQYQADLCSTNASQYKPISWKSSGSTGQKLQFILPEELKWSISSAMLWRYYSWAGVRLADRRATLGARIFATKPPFYMWNRWENQLLLSAHHLDDKNLEEYVRALQRFEVQFIQGHPSAVSVLASYMVAHNKCLPLKAVFTTGETVYEEDRAIIETAFQCRLLDSYGMGEAAVAAQQCSQGLGYHEISEYGIMELEPVDDGLYEIVGTSLHNFAMPFIRYRTGDLVEGASDHHECGCGRGLPLRFTRVIGRIDDRLKFRDKIVLPVTVRMFMKPLLKAGENYQLLQNDVSSLQLLLTNQVPRVRLQQIMEHLRSFVPSDVNIQVEHVENIRGRNNKVRNVVSKVR